MKYGKFDFKTLMKKDTRNLEEIMESKKTELDKKQKDKSYLVGHILWIQDQIDKI